MSSATSTTRPESQDTISHPPPPPTMSVSSPSPPPAREPLLKQEEDMALHPGRSHLRADTDHDEEDDGEEEEVRNDDDSEEIESIANGDADGYADEEEEEEEEEEPSDAEQEDEDDDVPTSRKRVSKATSSSNTMNSGTVAEAAIAGSGAMEEDGELSLSSDNDEDEEETSVHPNDDEYSNLPEETVCRWKDCGKVLPSLAALVIHLSDEHIGWKKTSYTCEWQGCARRPIAQTTRFALISHMRSHTKHKPYDCPVPECDKSFSRSDAMAKHLKCQHGDVPERFTGRKSRGRYTMKDPAASSTLLPSSSFGAKKRRHHGSDGEATLSSLPTKLRKLGSGDGRGSRGDHRHFHRKIADSLLLHHLDRPKRNGSRQHHSHHGQYYKDHDDLGHSSNPEDEDGDDAHGGEDDVEDSDFAVDNGQTARQRYGILKAKFQYIHNERESLESEYEDLKKRLTRLRCERELLLDALLVSEHGFQGPSLDDIDDSE